MDSSSAVLEDSLANLAGIPVRLSVVIPVFNEADTVAKGARVVLARPELTELLIVDDA